MNKCVTTNSNVQRTYVTELNLFYVNDATAIVLYCFPTIACRPELVCSLTIFYYCSFHMPLACLITSSASISSPARLLHQPVLCLRFSAFQTVHENSDGGHGSVLHQPVLCLRFSSYRLLMGTVVGNTGSVLHLPMVCLRVSAYRLLMGIVMGNTGHPTFYAQGQLVNI